MCPCGRVDQLISARASIDLRWCGILWIDTLVGRGREQGEMFPSLPLTPMAVLSFFYLFTQALINLCRPRRGK